MATKIQRFRYDEADWAELKAQAPGGNRSAVIGGLIDYYLDKPGSKLPDRPGHPPDPAAAEEHAAIRQFLDWRARKPGVDLPDRVPKT